MSKIKNQKSFFKQGFTLLEILVVIVIVTILSFISYASFATLHKNRILDKEAGRLVAILEEARSLTTSGKGATNHGVFFEITGNRVVLFKGDSFDENDPLNQEFILDPGVVILELNLENESDFVVFKRLKGETDQYGSIVLGLVHTLSSQKIIAVYPTGTIQKLD